MTSIEVDVIKIAARQDKEGFTVTFRMHPDDNYQPVMAAPFGEQFKMMLVPLDGDGNPVT